MTTAAIISVDMEARISNLERGLKAAESRVQVSALKMQKASSVELFSESRGIGDRFFGGLEKSAFKLIGGLAAIRAGVSAIEIGSALFSGNMERAREAVANFPLLGGIAISLADAWDALTGVTAENANIEKSLSRQKQMLEEIAILRRKALTEPERKAEDVSLSFIKSQEQIQAITDELKKARIKVEEPDILVTSTSSTIMKLAAEHQVKEKKQANDQIKRLNADLVIANATMNAQLEDQTRQRTAAETSMWESFWKMVTEGEKAKADSILRIRKFEEQQEENRIQKMANEAEAAANESLKTVKTFSDGADIGKQIEKITKPKVLIDLVLPKPGEIKSKIDKALGDFFDFEKDIEILGGRFGGKADRPEFGGSEVALARESVNISNTPVISTLKEANKLAMQVVKNTDAIAKAIRSGGAVFA